jgi:hypothetical protein
MKKTLLFIVLFIFVSITSNSQSIKDLDARNGYKEFKIGDSFEKYDGKLIFRDYLNNDKNRPTYTVKDEFLYKDLFGYSIKAMTLTFKDNKLIMIDIWLKEIVPVGVLWSFNADDFTNITNQFKSLFGEQKYGMFNDEQGTNMMMIWKGEKVQLWVKFVFRGTSEGGHYIKVTVIDSPMLARENNGF